MEKHTDLGHWRKSYNQGRLSDDLKAISPWILFAQWLEEAEQHPAIEEANAMSLVTMGTDGFPKARVVLLKQYSEEGLVFYTNYTSEKGQAIAANPSVGVSFFWPALERQVIVKGTAEKVTAATSDAYFASRPLGSKLGAIASDQSSVIESRDELERRLLTVENTYANQTPDRPNHWGGYCIQPHAIEFWQGRPNRLHDRLLYSRTDDQQWSAQRLSP